LQRDRDNVPDAPHTRGATVLGLVTRG